MTTIYRQELEQVFSTPVCNKQVEQFSKLPLEELYLRLDQAKRNLKNLRRIWGQLHAVDRLTAKYAIGEVMTVEYYRVQNLRDAILKPRRLKLLHGNEMYQGQTRLGIDYYITVETVINPGEYHEEIELHFGTPTGPLHGYREMEWPERPEKYVLELIKWLEVG